MTDRASSASLADSSVVVRALRAIARIIAVSVTRTAAWGRETNERIRIGLRIETAPSRRPLSSDQFEAFLLDSRVVRGIWSALAVPERAWKTASTREVVQRFLDFDPSARVRLAGWTIVSAAVTHVIALVVVDVSVGQIGWISRAIAGAIGVAMMLRPEAFVAAWRTSLTRKRAKSPDARH